MAVPDLLNNPLGLSSFTGSPGKEKPAVVPSSQMGFPAIERPADPLPEIERRRGEIGTETANIDAKIIQNLADQGQFQAQQAKQKVESEAKSLRELDTSRKALEKSLYESPAYKTIQEKSKELAEKSTFNPDQQNAQTLAAVFSIIGAAGFLLGGNNKNTAKSALAAMNGMAEGYAKGRDQYAKDQRAVFETNQKALRGTLDSLEKAFTYELEQNKNDLESATRNAKISALERDASFINANIDKYGLVSTLEQLRSNKKRLETVLDALQKKEDAYKSTLEKEWFSSKEKEAVAQAAQERVRYQEQERTAREQERRQDQERKEKERREDTQSFQREMARFRVENRPEKGGGTSGDKFGFGDIIATNLNEAVGTIANIVNLPHDVTGGIFQGRNTSGLLMAPLGVLAQELTDEDVQRYNKEIKNFGKFASRVVSGGRVVPASVQKDFEDQFVINKGDSPLSVLTSLAQMRQTLERATEVKLKSSSTDPGLKTLYQDGLDVIREKIPFTVNDVNTFANQRDKKKTFSQMFGEYGFRSPSAMTGAATSTPSTTAPAQPKTPAIPPGVPSTAQYSPSQNSWWWQENNQWKSKKVD
jgi:chemotaxis protein histidine kinase CheA